LRTNRLAHAAVTAGAAGSAIRRAGNRIEKTLDTRIEVFRFYSVEVNRRQLIVSIANSSQQSVDGPGGDSSRPDCFRKQSRFNGVADGKYLLVNCPELVINNNKSVFSFISSVKKLSSGTSPTAKITVSAGNISPSVSSTPLLVTALVKRGQRNFAPAASAWLLSFPKEAGC